MKVLLIVISAILVLLGLSTLALGIVPYSLYYTLIGGGMDNNYFKIDREDAAPLWRSREYYHLPYNDLEIRKKFWEPFYLQKVTILMPTRHPYLRPKPYILTRLGGKRLRHPLFGFKVVKKEESGKYKEYLKYEYIGEKVFSLHLYDQKIFKLPLFKKMLLSKSEGQIWKDLFSKDLLLGDYKSFKFANIRNYLKYSYEQLVYRAYLFYLRTIYFPKRVEGFEFNPDSKVGRVLIEDTKSFIKEIYYQLHDGNVYLFALSSRKNEKSVAFFRDDFFDRIHIQNFNVEEQNRVYLSYKNLTKDEQLSPLGYAHLYSDLTLKKGEEEEEFLKRIIQFIERDDSAYYFLEPLYQYALERYKRTFSLSSKFVDQDEELKLRRNIDLETQREIEKIKKEKVIAPEKEFKSDKEQVEFYLNSTKDKFELIDDEMNL